MGERPVKGIGDLYKPFELDELHNDAEVITQGCTLECGALDHVLVSRTDYKSKGDGLLGTFLVYSSSLLKSFHLPWFVLLKSRYPIFLL
ncbi:hypothetical protein VNO78_25434 [Psophocarpus tetragonolobus]|uniref:Uncharacterized protein n=1 Tax=Psophocarpus tetragonolobus TaxID=3891 RepID=A0AAN9XFB5_PSOTE